MFRELYKKSDRLSYENMAMEYLVNDILRDKLRGPEKSKQMTGMHMEDSYRKEVIPSMFYTFMYNSPEEFAMGKVGYKDVVPCMLCTNITSDCISGMNFNLIPNNIRAEILDIIYSSYKSFYDTELSKAVERDAAVINEPFATTLLNATTRKAFLSYLDDRCGIKVSSSYRNYRREMITNIRMIEYDTWKFIPFLVFRDSVRGGGLSAIQAEMTKTQPLNK